MNVLLVDGYNVIGAWPELNELAKQDFAAARDRLIDKMAEYQAYTGWRVLVVFDAHLVPGMASKSKQSRVEVIYTSENETADERIERLVSVFKNVKTRVYVATSDFTEQWTVFSKGALRKSSRELYKEVEAMERKISAKLSDNNRSEQSARIMLNSEMVKIFEKWRRGD